MYTVYSLVDPRNDATRYVGITENIYSRFTQHIRRDGVNPAKDAWIQELREASVMLVMKSLEYVEGFEEARAREQYWIKHFVRQGSMLLNQQDLTIFTYDDFMSFFKTENEEEVTVREEEATRPIAPKRTRKSEPVSSVSIKEAALLLGISPSRVRDLKSKGRLRSPSRNQKLILISSIEAYEKIRPRSTKLNAI